MYVLLLVAEHRTPASFAWVQRWLRLYIQSLNRPSLPVHTARSATIGPSPCPNKAPENGVAAMEINVSHTTLSKLKYESWKLTCPCIA